MPLPTTLTSRFRRLRADVSDFISPLYCCACGARLSPCENCVCAPCFSKLEDTRFSPSPGEESFMDKLLQGEIRLEKATAVYLYKGSARDIIHSVKYHDKWEAGVWLGTVAARKLRPSGFFDGIDIIVPTPLHWKRQLDRGYNQCHWIARGLSDVTGIEVRKDIVCRFKNNVSQTKLNSQERAANVKGIFRLKNKDKCAGKHILLVDDVMTTGSTISEIARVLGTVPGVRLSVLVIAFAKQPSPTNIFQPLPFD